ncbi:MAG TPA: hypothetical protein VJV78_19535 [Polyangiales bacterium]|nr:hypothetical protein [Polyangiales bacterium]
MLERSKQLWQTMCAHGARGLLCCALLAGCSFDDEMTIAAPNTCTLPTDCDEGLKCQAGVCVQAANAPLNVTLEVTPKRMPDGSQPFPILYGPFPLQDAQRDFPLPLPIAVSGTIKNDKENINAQLSFLQLKTPASLARPIQARSSLIGLRAGFSVQLLSGKEYRVTVQPPTESKLPPYSMVFTATPGESLDIDYKTLPSTTQNFWIKNLPTLADGQKFVLKARDKTTNDVISSAEDLVGGRGALQFLQSPLPAYKLELVVEKNFGALTAAAGSSCNTAAPQVPTYTIDDSALKREASTKTQGAFDLSVELPTLPAAVPYSGEIQLCAPSKGAENLLVSLRSSGLAISNLPQGITASFSVSATADRETTTRQTFCTRVVPGEYVVLVTPPANVNCEIFAEKRQILAPTEEQPDSLDLRQPTKLNGKILDNNMVPMANATIDAIALGIDTTDMLAESDLTVPIYNRSRQASSKSNGTFELFVDVGVYDLIVKPPMQSGYGWQIRPGLTVGSARREDFSTRVDLAAPVLVEGSLRYMDNTANTRSSLAGADVHAYTVQNEGEPNARGVEIGHTQADEQGNVMLLISPEFQLSW